MTAKAELENLKLSKEIGLEWFKIHADQRLKVFNFFLLIAGFCIGGFFAALQIKSSIAASVVAFLLGAVCVCFKLLDQRTSQLVKHGEELLEYCLVRIGVDETMPNPIKLSNEKKGTKSYRQIFNALFLLFGLMSLIGMAFPWISVASCKQ